MIGRRVTRLKSVLWGPHEQWDQIIDDGNTTSALTVRKSNWYLKSSTYGKFTVGLEGTATYHLLDDADATNTAISRMPRLQRLLREGSSFAATAMAWAVVRLAQACAGVTSS